MYRSAAVGRGAGQVFRGAGKGVGHVLGGGKFQGQLCCSFSHTVTLTYSFQLLVEQCR
jgi:hypothetical protein